MTNRDPVDLVDALRMAGENGKAAAVFFVFERAHAEAAGLYAQLVVQLCESARLQHGFADVRPNAGLVDALTRWGRPGAGHRYLAFAGGVAGDVVFGGTGDDEAGFLDVVTRCARQLEVINRDAFGGALAVVLVSGVDDPTLARRIGEAIDFGEALGRAERIGAR